ncbi:MAG TPA: gamma-aminobutyraldehyde dehydrogenase [Candidatus Xenobia bacterium]
MANVATKQHQLFIDGAWKDSQGGSTAEVLNPATEEVLATVYKASEKDVEAAVEAASRAFEGWAETPPADRALALLKLADRIETNSEELARIEADNVGKPMELARSEVPFMVDNLRFFAGAARCMEGRAAGEYMRGYTSWIRREPVGVVGSIAPWNYPLMMAVWKIGPALAAGNTVVLKPASITPLTALRLADLAADLFPPGVLNVLTGAGDVVGVGLVKHPKVALVSLTGDTATGIEIARAAASSLKRCHLELGGKAPVLIFDDADLDLVAEKLQFGGFANSGQDCTAACRVYASAKIFDGFLSKFVPLVEKLKLGVPSDPETTMGPLVSKSHRERVAGFIDRARGQKHIQVATGGKAGTGQGFFYHPTVLAGAEQKDEVVQKEMFGPVVTVTRFNSDEDAIRWANDTEYGLASSVFTTNLSRALNASRKLHFGCVWINDHMPLVSEMPHGGFKKSGYGKDMSMYALEDYTETKHVMARI